MGAFATGVAVITINEESFQGITVNSFSSLSLEPMMVLFNLEKQAVRFDAFHSCKEFVVNILSEGQESISKVFSSADARQWQKYYCEIDQLPTIQGVLCYIHCVKYRVYDGGDHKIIVGIVKNMKKLSCGKPLIYFQGNYHVIKDE